MPVTYVYGRLATEVNMDGVRGWRRGINADCSTRGYVNMQDQPSEVTDTRLVKAGVDEKDISTETTIPKAGFDHRQLGKYLQRKQDEAKDPIVSTNIETRNKQFRCSSSVTK